METLIWIIKIAMIIFFDGQLVVFVGLLVWIVWEEAIKPRLIPQAEIDALAGDWIARHNNPEQSACDERWRAWHRCEGAEQIKWKRIRKSIDRMRQS